MSKIPNRSPQHVCKHPCDRRPKGRQTALSAPSRHRSPTFSPTVRGSRLTPAAASRCSKICPIDRPRQHVCKHPCDRRPKGRQTALSAPSRHRSPTLASTAHAHGHSRRSRCSMVENRSRRRPAPLCVPASARPETQGHQRPKVRHTVCRCRANALQHWLRLRAPTGTVTASRVDPPAARWPHALAPRHTERSRNPRVRQPAPHRAARLRTLP